MSRYSIALNKTPKEIEREHLITGFGFDKEIDSKHRSVFFLRSKEIARVGIVFDDPGSLFYCAKVHFYKSHRFLCKSTPGHLAYCCQPDYPGRQPGIRIATILVQYSSNNVDLENIKVLPWVFGKIMFGRIKEANELFSIDKTDFLLKCQNDNAYRFKNYDLMSMNSPPLWQELEMKSRILEIHSHLKRNIRSYLANDYSENDILNVISQPDIRIEETGGRAGLVPRELPSVNVNRDWNQVGSNRRLPRDPDHGRLRLNEINLEDLFGDMDD